MRELRLTTVERRPSRWRRDRERKLLARGAVRTYTRAPKPDALGVIAPSTRRHPSPLSLSPSSTLTYLSLSPLPPRPQQPLIPVYYAPPSPRAPTGASTSSYLDIERAEGTQHYADDTQKRERPPPKGKEGYQNPWLRAFAPFKCSNIAAFYFHVSDFFFFSYRVRSSPSPPDVPPFLFLFIFLCFRWSGVRPGLR